MDILYSDPPDVQMVGCAYSIIKTEFKNHTNIVKCTAKIEQMRVGSAVIK